MMGFVGVLKLYCMLLEWLVELVCLWVVFFNQCWFCMVICYMDVFNDGVDEGVVCLLEKFQEVENLLDVEKVVICFGELMVIDYLVINDVVYDDLCVYFSEVQIVELGMIVVFFVGFGCLGVIYYMVEELFEFYQFIEGFIVFWGEDVI